MPQETLKQDVVEFRQRLRQHAVFNSVQSLQALRTFSSIHIFLVWDYMSLLKSLQAGLNRSVIPWVPSKTPYLSYLINTLVLKEESDIGVDGQYASQYEMYRMAMQLLEADTGLIDQLMGNVDKGIPIFHAIEISPIPGPLKDFLEYTFWVVQEASLHEKAAVLCYGREGFGHQLLFEKVKILQPEHPEETAPLLYYLRRKNEVNEKYHSELTRLLLQELCADDQEKWEEATAAAAQSLRNRLRLFDFIHSRINREGSLDSRDRSQAKLN